MMRLLATLSLTLWLVAGCTPTTTTVDPSSAGTAQDYCADVVCKIDRVIEGSDRLIESDNPAHCAQVRSATTRLAVIRTLATGQLGAHG